MTREHLRQTGRTTRMIAAAAKYVEESEDHHAYLVFSNTEQGRRWSLYAMEVHAAQFIRMFCVAKDTARLDLEDMSISREGYNPSTDRVFVDHCVLESHLAKALEEVDRYNEGPAHLSFGTWRRLPADRNPFEGLNLHEATARLRGLLAYFDWNSGLEEVLFGQIETYVPSLLSYVRAHMEKMETTWTSLEDELPPYGEQVLFCMARVGPAYVTAGFREEDSISSAGLVFPLRGHLTHWMPMLPTPTPPPKEEEPHQGPETPLEEVQEGQRLPEVPFHPASDYRTSLFAVRDIQLDNSSGSPHITFTIRTRGGERIRITESALRIFLHGYSLPDEANIGLSDQAMLRESLLQFGIDWENF